MRKGIQLLGVLALFVLSVAGCKDSYQTESSEKQAIQYYKDKYGEKVRVQESHGLGSYTLFSYTYYGYEYVMSDGTSVVYFDDTHEYCDNRQAREIEEESTKLAKELIEKNVSKAYVLPTVTQIGEGIYFDTYVGETNVYHEYFDGDIRDFLERERQPVIFSWIGETEQDLSEFYYQASISKEEIEEQWKEFAQYFEGYVTGGVLTNDYYNANKEKGFSIFDEGYLMHYSIGLWGEPTVETYKPHLIEAHSDIWITSEVYDYQLPEHGVKLTPIDEEGHYTLDFSYEVDDDIKADYFSVKNDTDHSIFLNKDVDVYKRIVSPNEIKGSVTLMDKTTYFIGDEKKVLPHFEVVSMGEEEIVLRYRSYHLDQIDDVVVEPWVLVKDEDAIGASFINQKAPIEVINKDSETITYRILFEPHTRRNDNDLNIEVHYVIDGVEDDYPRLRFQYLFSLDHGIIEEK